MKKDKLYLFTFLSLLIVVFSIEYLGMNYLLEASMNRLLKNQITASKREAKEMAGLIASQITNGISKETLISNIQSSIENTNTELGFLCMFDITGKEICHPNRRKIGSIIKLDESYVSEINSNNTTKDFYYYLKNNKEGGGLREFTNKKKASEIIYVHPVNNSDWIIAAHANVSKINEEINGLRNTFIIANFITGSIIVFLSFFLIRIVGSKYENQLENKNIRLTDELLKLSKKDLTALNEKKARNNSNEKKRILTYYRNELVPLATTDIAYVYTENAITYIKSIDNKLSHSNTSLEEIYKNLDSHHFFRANRQFIISIIAINKILKYGKNQLKIVVAPNSDIEIIISKNKAAEFKNWLNT